MEEHSLAPSGAGGGHRLAELVAIHQQLQVVRRNGLIARSAGADHAHVLVMTAVVVTPGIGRAIGQKLLTAAAGKIVQEDGPTARAVEAAVAVRRCARESELVARHLCVVDVKVIVADRPPGAGSTLDLETALVLRGATDEPEPGCCLRWRRGRRMVRLDRQVARERTDLAAREPQRVDAGGQGESVGGSAAMVGQARAEIRARVVVATSAAWVGRTQVERIGVSGVRDEGGVAGRARGVGEAVSALPGLEGDRVRPIGRRKNLNGEGRGTKTSVGRGAVVGRRLEIDLVRRGMHADGGVHRCKLRQGHPVEPRRRRRRCGLLRGPLQVEALDHGARSRGQDEVDRRAECGGQVAQVNLFLRVR